MVDHSIYENCEPCPACELRRESIVGHVNAFGPVTDHRHVFVECNECGGYGLKPIPAVEIVARAAEWARLNYWPAREAAWAAQNGNVVDISAQRKKRVGRK